MKNIRLGKKGQEEGTHYSAWLQLILIIVLLLILMTIVFKKIMPGVLT